MAQVVALMDDPFFQAKLSGTAKLLGIELRTCTTADALAIEIAQRPANLVVVDLNSRNNPLQAIQNLRAIAPNVPIIAFLSHVQVELAEQARAAGCHEVMPRSKFTKDLATILERAKSKPS